MAEFIIDIPDIQLKKAIDPIDLDFKEIHLKAFGLI